MDHHCVTPPFQVDTIMFEGHDTTASNTTFTLFLLATHPEIQARAREEMDEIFGEDRDRDATAEDIARMKYLECCVKESLRLFPTVPVMTRTVHEDVVIEVGRNTLLIIDTSL